MRNVFAETLYSHAKSNDNIFVVVADISPAGSMNKFREECSERFIDVGVAEQSMIGICAGLALKDCRPYAYSIATFTLFRPYEFVRVDLCYQNLPVVIVGMGAGSVYSNLGGTHQAQEDIAIASALPNMQILAPCDPLETKLATDFSALENSGPLYLRLGKAGEKNITQNAEQFVFGKIRYLQRGSDICLIGYGPILANCIELAQKLEKAGLSVSVISNHTLKPLDKKGLVNMLHQHSQVVVIEEHVSHGGLLSQVKQIAWDHKVQTSILGYTLQDKFSHCYGSYLELLSSHGICFDNIYTNILTSFKKISKAEYVE